MGLKTLFFTLKIEIGKNCINRSVKGITKNIIVNFDKIWLNMFRTGRDINFGSKNAVFYLKNWNRKKMYHQKCKEYQQDHYCKFWTNLVEDVPSNKMLFFTLQFWNRKKCINRSVKGTHKNISVNFDEIWFNNSVFWPKTFISARLEHLESNFFKICNKVLVATL